jgi:hypothetical protein
VRFSGSGEQRELGIQNRGRVRLFIVRNGKLTVPWQLVSPHILPIARSTA